ncbi:Transport protein particle subunit trs85-2 [Erysiphe neolycopersici]|uniref:Transport protein particle subunit trs85-2 n=1 Tax=Erysiphe neolycopersici TaxID=212602 RepID=A0A420HSI2_9PEZI|nr:Transport protein particle subunit trs85-2 [Erysiphe neolycopersici]
MPQLSTLDYPGNQADTPPLKSQNHRGSLEFNSMLSSVPNESQRAFDTSVSSVITTIVPKELGSPSPGSQGTVPRVQVDSVYQNLYEKNQYFKQVSKIEDPRKLIIQGFVPHIAVHTSTDTNDLVNEKGFKGGLCEILRPFGEHIQGKVNVRDSVGAGKTWEDYAVHFVKLGDGIAKAKDSQKRIDEEILAGNGIKKFMDVSLHRAKPEVITSIESLVDTYLTHAEDFPSQNGMEDYLSQDDKSQSPDRLSPFYTLYLRRLISGVPIAPHETFSHPVACIIAISSRNSNPIETLRELYEESSRGEKRLPIWVNNDYLRYYVLVHDEERNDIKVSIALFDQMKRHFGLHCHLLRLRSSQCVASDDDSVDFPRCTWLSAQEEIAEIQKQDMKGDVQDSNSCIYESDTTAIKAFIREMVTQSIIPSMERCVATWNDQIASRRKGISGRILSISRQWTGFGRNSRNSVSGSSGSTGSNSNYDQGLDYYKPDTPEALMRKLADYAFMLRDWKLALSTYDLLRSDFSSDKAWKYHAATNEMAAISALLAPSSMSSKTRLETVDQFLETALYSYITRCGASYGALRCLTLGMELLRLRGGTAISDAAKWGLRILEFKVVGAVGDALIKERISACYASRIGIGSRRWGSRNRKSALWGLQAAESWLALGKPQRSKRQLNDAISKYSLLKSKNALETYPAASAFIKSLQREVQLALLPVTIEGPELTEETMIDEESEGFNSRPHRRSIMGGNMPPLASLATTPLKATFLENENDPLKLDLFE